MLRELDETEGGRDVSRGHGGDLQRSQQAVCVCASYLGISSFPHSKMHGRPCG